MNTKRILLTTALCLFMAISSFATVYYVTPTGGGNGNGRFWANAFNGLQAALNTVADGDEIWVKAATYKPTEIAGNGTTDRDKAFVLVKGVKIYGGFAGAETALDQRDWTKNVTILSGDLGAVVDTDNAYHVVISAGDAGTAALDGFTITGGNASGANSITVNDLTIYKTSGGAIYCHTSSPTLANLTIRGNKAGDYGGGIYNNSSSPALTNVTISGNTANIGGGIYSASSSSPVLTDVTISGNTANSTSHGGGGIYNTASSLVLTNVTIKENTAANYGGGIYNSESAPLLVNVLIAGNKKGASFSSGGILNSGSSPVLVNTTIAGNSGYGMSNASSTAYSHPKFYNCLIAGNESGVGNESGSSATYDHSLVQGINPGGDNLNGIGINAAAIFIAPAAHADVPTAAGDYRLRTGRSSPAGTRKPP